MLGFSIQYHRVYANGSWTWEFLRYLQLGWQYLKLGGLALRFKHNSSQNLSTTRAICKFKLHRQPRYTIYTREWAIWKISINWGLSKWQIVSSAANAKLCINYRKDILSNKVTLRRGLEDRSITTQSRTEKEAAQVEGPAIHLQSLLVTYLLLFTGNWHYQVNSTGDLQRG